jgi:histidinol-phosphate phosphatase family protein
MVSDKLIILDRDGVLNRKPPENDYVKSMKELQINHRLIALLARIPIQVKIACATNQQGIEKGLLSTHTLGEIHGEINKELRRVSSKEISFFVCPHLSSRNCHCRKPKPGLLFEAMKYFGCDEKSTIFVGDQDSDFEAAKNANISFIRYEKFEKFELQITNFLSELC